MKLNVGNNISADNFNDLFVNAVNAIFVHGEWVKPRGLNCNELIATQLILRDPSKCLITLKERKLNYAYLIIEKMMYLSQFQDPEILIAYNAKMQNYLNTGNGLFDGAYGPRIGQSHQLDYVYRTLLKDPDSRQATITINDYTDRRDSKDIPCFSAGTVIHSPEKNITISALSKKFKNGLKKFPIYTLNEKTKDIEIKYCTNAFKKSKKERLIKVQFDYGGVECTPNHLFFIKRYKKYEWIEAKNLKENDRIVPIRYLQDKKGLSIVKNVGENWSYKNRFRVAREYCEFIGENCEDKEVHHINLNQLENSYKNLLVVSKEKHRAIHQTLNNSNTKVYQNLSKRNLYKNKFSNYFDKIFESNKVSKVNSVKKLDRLHDVYDLSVEDNNNFFVNSGICVHNCTMYLHFLIRDEKLNLIVNMRSNDILWGTCLDIPAFCLLQETMAFWLGVNSGYYIHNASSLHYYEEFEEQLLSYIKEENKETNDEIIPQWTVPYKETKEALNEFWEQEQVVREYKSFKETQWPTINKYLERLLEYWEKKDVKQKS